MKTLLLLIAFFVVPFCDMTTSQSVSQPELAAVTQWIGNNHGNSDNLSHYDLDTLNAFSVTLNDMIVKDWQLIKALLNFADRTYSKAYINMNYEAVWIQLQKNTSMQRSKIIFEFATSVRNNIFLMEELKNNVTLHVLNEIASFLTELLYPNNTMDTELTRIIFKYLDSSNDTELVSVFNRVYDALLYKRSLNSVAERLYTLPFSNNQLSIAYLLLARRIEIKNDQELAAIKRHVIELCGRENLTLSDRLLRKADTIRIGSKFLKDRDSPYHVGLCQNSTNLCVLGQESVNVQVERLFKQKTQYAFKIPGAGYINYEENTATVTNETFWWDVSSVEGVLYLRKDDMFVCAGFNPTGVIAVHDQFEDEECAWIIELGI